MARPAELQTRPPPLPDDLVCEHKLEILARRRGVTVNQLAGGVGISPVTLDLKLAVPPRGFRVWLESALGVEPGWLRFRYCSTENR